MDLNCLFPVFLLLGAAGATTDPTDQSVMNDLLKGIENADILGWGGTDACAWKHVTCRDGQVTGLNMQSLGLRGSLPANLNKLGALTQLSLQSNAFSGPLPSLAGLANLEVAFLNDNNFDTIPPDFFGNLSALRGIYLNNNPLNATSGGWRLTDDLLGSPQLANLSLYNTSLAGHLPDFLGSLGSLQVLSVPYNRLSGSLPAGLNATALQVLIANSQNLTGGLGVLAAIPDLTTVWLHSNSFSGTIPAGVPTGLQELLLSENRLVGPVPPELGKLKSLRNLSVDNNLLDGPLPVMPASVRFTYANNFFCGGVGEQCAPEVMALLGFLADVGYPADVVRSWTENNPCSDWTGVTCNAERHVSILNLAKRGLSGTISSSLSNLTALTILKLNDNRLTGRIPDSLTKLGALKQLDVSNNNLTGPVPEFRSQVRLNTAGNAFINTVVSPEASPAPAEESSARPQKKTQKSKLAGILVGCLAVGALCLLSVIIFLKWRKKPGKKRPTPSPAGIPTEPASATGGFGASQGYTVYPFTVLEKATEDFSPSRLLGKGGFGSVYEGILPDGHKVAVKRMDPEVVSSKGLQEFQAEINMLGKVRHRNLVALLGYCTEKNERLLVYEFMCEGTLSQHLFGWAEKRLRPLDWSCRMLIALDVAQGMQYLHNLAYRIIIHRDLKPSNILLDDKLRAKVSDFGLAKLASEDKVSVETRLAGTFGYLAPEYASTGRVNTKSDVYSFGVVLMELITGQRALDEKRPEDRVHLVPWFRHICRDQEELKKVIDPVLQATEEDMKGITEVAELAWHCTQREPAARPDMGHAVAVLGPLVREWKPASDTEETQRGMTPEQAFRQWRIFDDSSFSLPSGTGADVGSSQQTDIAPPASVSAR